MKGFATLLTLFLVGAASAFVPSTSKSSFVGSSTVVSRTTSPFAPREGQPAALERQRRSVAPIQTMGLFGLGPPEIAVILVAAAFLLGPQKLAELGKDAGKIAGELKEVPKEFQKGMAEGEQQAAATKKELTGETSEEVKDAETE